MGLTRLVFIFIAHIASTTCVAQTDSAIASIQEVPLKYIQQVDHKIETYGNRITSKTEKTLIKLSRWENKIKSLLEKNSPETAQKLFGSNQLTFTSMLQKINEGKSIAENYKTKFDDYQDKLRSNMAYLKEQKGKLDDKMAKPIEKANQKLEVLDNSLKSSEALEQFIKERKRQLIDQSIQYIGKSKYLTKINKEAYYYTETLRNYKELFNDKKKAEQTAINILNKIPAFQKFMKENSVLASLFSIPSNYGSAQSLAGLQTRASVQSIVQNQIAGSGPNAQQLIMQNFQSGQAELGKLKDKILKAGGTSSDTEIPDFKPNQQKTKTLMQRLEFGNNLQVTKPNGYIPNTADVGLSLGYKLNNKSVIGLGVSYKMGIGRIDRLSITHQGVGLRSFVDWKMKKQFFISGGFEMNYNAAFKNIERLQNYNDWQQSGLIGLTKNLKIKTKWFKGSKIQLLYDMLYREHNPVSQPILFRTGYNF